MTPAQKAAVAILRAAKREIETKGWTQQESGGCENFALPCCPAIALDRVKTRLGDTVLAGPAYRAAIGARSIPAWNDEPGRTLDEVLSAFDKAVALVESGAVS